MNLNAKKKPRLAYLLLLACTLVSAALLAGCANKPPSCPKPAEFCLDPKLVGIWLDTRPNLLSAYFPEVRGIEIAQDGKIHAIGFNYHTGKIARASYRANPFEFEYACQGKYVEHGLAYGEDYLNCKTYLVNEKELRLTDPRYRDSSNYARGFIGQTVTQPMDIRFDMLIDGKPYPFDDVSHEWPSRSVYRQNSDKGFALSFKGRNGYQTVLLSISLKKFHGPGVYGLSKEDDYSILFDKRGGGDGFVIIDKIASAASANFVEVTAVDIQNKRATGRFEMTLEGYKGITRTLSATFDVPLIIPPPRPEVTQ